MPSASTHATASSGSRSLSATWPVALWAVLQVAALGLAAAQVRLSANYPQPAERQAIQILLVVQVLGAALLFPVLLRTWESALVIAIVSIPFLKLGLMLSDRMDASLRALSIFIVGWLAVLAMWGHMLRSTRWQLIAVAVATALAVGGALAWYVGAEAHGGGAAVVDWNNEAARGPVMGVLAVLNRGFQARDAWWQLAVLVGVSTVTWMIRLRLRQDIHKGSH